VAARLGNVPVRERLEAGATAGARAATVIGDTSPLLEEGDTSPLRQK
jgi:hypothetical protein